MNKPRIKIHRKKIEAFCKKYQIRKLAFFGSVLRDDFGPESDVDVIVEFEPGATPGLKFFTLPDELKQIIGRDVDLLTFEGVKHSRNPIRREAILKSAQVYYVA